MSGLDDIRATFFEECAELLEQLEAGLLALEANQQGPDTLDAIFRAVHSIKGGAGAFHLSALVELSHEFETVLDGLRTGRLQPDPDLIRTLLRAADTLTDCVHASQADPDTTIEVPADLLTLSGQMSAGDTTEPDDDPFGLGFAPVPLDLMSDAAPQDVQATPSMPQPDAGDSMVAWKLEFRCEADLLESGNEPLFLFRSLAVLGRLHVCCCDDDLPSLDRLDISHPFLRWHITLFPTASDLTETEIEAVFEFAEGLCTIGLERCEAVAPDESHLVATDDTQTAPPSVVLPETAPLPPVPAEPSGGTEAPPATANKPSSLATSIRVDLNRVDRLVNLVGELVISQSMLAQSIGRDALAANSASAAGLDDLQQLTRDIQDSVMAIRAQPVRSLFQRMSRIVREAAQQTGKDVSLITEGEMTEIDKTVVERLADPLTHMIRNAIDHGLESAADRKLAGKDPTGHVRLSARQQADRVIIEVGDDGAGINRRRVLDRAIERGLVAEDRQLDPADIDRLLFLPGFSTNTEVSSLSGRGVGMDVVQRSIKDLNGTVAITSVEGVGTTMSISLPLTLAILDGMIVRTGDQRLVIPLSAILETQLYSSARIEKLGAHRTVVMLHDDVVPLVDLGRSMGFEAQPQPGDDEDRALLFIQSDDRPNFAVVVDAIEAQRQVVIKGLTDSFGRIPCVSAATILGDGSVALIVDPAGLHVAGSDNRSPFQPRPEVMASC